MNHRVLQQLIDNAELLDGVDDGYGRERAERELQEIFLLGCKYGYESLKTSYATRQNGLHLVLNRRLKSIEKFLNELGAAPKEVK